jgi:hypothetical protein
MAASLNTLSEILKEYYLGPVAEQLNNEVLLLSRLETKSEDLVGKRAYVPLHYGRSTGIGARGEAQALPAAGSQAYDKAVYDLKYLYGRVEVTGPSMAKTKNEAGAFLQALKSELDGIRNDLKKDLARQIYGDGTGTIATAVTGGTHSTTAIEVGAEPLRKGQIYPGMKVNVYDDNVSADHTHAGGAVFTVASVNVTTGTVTVTETSTAAFDDDDTIRRAGVQTVTPAVGNTYSLSDEIDGLRRIVPDAAANTFGGINAATSQWWDNVRVEATGGVLTLDVIQQALNLARINGGMPTSVITSLGLQREFYDLLNEDVRYVDPASLNYAAGFKTLSYNGMPLIADIDAPYGLMYILDESTMKVFSDQDWHFLDADGQTLRQRADYDAFEAIMTRYLNLGATRRNNQVVIKGDAAAAVAGFLEVDGGADAGF